jgi:hemoglobin
MAQTIFERYGGFAKLNQVVSAFYDKVLDDPLTAPYFEGIDMRRVIDHQTKFIASITGGPASYTNDALERLHAPLAVSEEAFAQVATLLKETLEDFGLENNDVQHVCHQMVSRKHLIVKR